ncbi:MAG: zinc ABC transporter substrate-binding protein, partial [Planctomycetes bacterium]|nr:zinc ABC transporter substrate-binding protein [Planctomycetota bacterium]
SLVFLTKSRPANQPEKPLIMATIPPLAMIVQEVAGDRFAVESVISASDSPHTYQFKPSTRAKVETARAVFSVGEGLDPWLEDVEAKHHLVLFPKIEHKYMLHMGEHHHEESGDHHHEHGDHDPHFWLACDAIRSLLKPIAAHLSEIDPEGEATYTGNAERLDRELRALRDEITDKLKPLHHKAFVQFHPSMNYFLKEHLLVDGGVVMMNPAAAVSPKHKAELLESLKAKQALAIFIEPQFDPKHAKELADVAGIPVIEVDPLGGVEGRNTIKDLLRYNADQILKAAGATKE